MARSFVQDLMTMLQLLSAARLGFVCTFDTFQLRFVVLVAATAALQLVALSIRQLSESSSLRLSHVSLCLWLLQLGQLHTLPLALYSQSRYRVLWRRACSAATHHSSLALFTYAASFVL